VDAKKYSAKLDAGEEAQFVPFVHELIGTAFAMIQPLFLTDLAVTSKSDDSPVTAADRGAEQALRAKIEQRYPQHGIVGEEFGVKDGGRYRWILDPIDGTRAFISNCFLFGTLIALERNDGGGFRPVLGCIAHAATGMALIGHARRTTLFRSDSSQRTVEVRPARDLAKATVLMSSLPGSAEQGADPAVARIAARAGMARTWGDCFGYFALATGGADAMFDPQLSYWDVAAIVPVVEGAGGRVTSWRGGNPLADLSLIAAANDGLLEEMLALANAPPTASGSGLG